MGENSQLEIVQLPMALLTPDPKNARGHSRRNIESIAASLRRFGQRKPLVVQRRGEGELVVRAGNGTLAAAELLGWKTIAAAVFEERDDVAAAYGLADNRTAELAHWKADALADVLDGLTEGLEQGELFNFDSIGFSAAEVERALGRAETAQDRVPDEVAERVGPGEIWQLGAHRLACGDATDPELVAQLLAGDEPFLMVTDPPYGVEYEPEWRADYAEAGQQLDYGARRTGKVSNNDRADWGAAFDLFPGDVAYTWSPAGYLLVTTGGVLQRCGFEIRNEIIWVKPHFPISRGHYTYQHEPCWYAVRKGGESKWVGDASESTTWKIELDENVAGGHSTQKPVECMGRPIRNHGGKGDDVYDPFCGSGTTLIAAEQLGRRCFAVEFEPHYCDVIVARWEKLTGKEAARV